MRDFWPFVIDILVFALLKCFDKTSISAWLALFSMAVSRTKTNKDPSLQVSTSGPLLLPGLIKI